MDSDPPAPDHLLGANGIVTWDRFLEVLDQECLNVIVEIVAKRMVDEYLELREALTE